MQLSLSASYDATPEELFALITDATFHEQVCESFQTRAYDVTVRDSGADTVVRVQWETRPSDVPTVARKLVHQPLVVVQTKIWHPASDDGARAAEVEGEVTGAPVKLIGTTRIVPDGRTTLQAFDLEVTAATPVIGKRIERVVAEAVRARLERKFEVAWSWLSGAI